MTNYQDKAAKYVGEISKKIATKVATFIGGEIAGEIVGGITTILGFIGDAVQRDKCKLGCCPAKNLAGSWACKYQSKSTCNGHYSDYPGHGDHACWWNDVLNICEIGVACRDQTFNFFALFGSVCPSCSTCPDPEPQWSKEALKKAGLPSRFYVDPAKEFLWCAPRGSNGSCSSNKFQLACEESYADSDMDRNCRWAQTKMGNMCAPGEKCDNARERKGAANKLGLQYYSGAWRRNGVPITDQTDHAANRGGASAQTAASLRDALEKGFSEGFKNCAKACVTASSKKDCAKQCIFKFHS